MDHFNLYKDIKDRTDGEIYIGVVGPVRCGKSTFIKRFMNLLVLPFMEDENEKERAQDEMPQSAGGRTVTTTEPKFIPKEAAHIRLGYLFLIFHVLSVLLSVSKSAHRRFHAEALPSRYYNTPYRQFPSENFCSVFLLFSSPAFYVRIFPRF